MQMADNEKPKGIMTPAITQLGMVLNSIQPANSPLYFQPIEGFYYGYLNHKLCCERFGWSPEDFEFTMKPVDELLDLMKGLHIPIYGDINY